MSKEDKTNLSRRNLLKAAAGVAGAAAGTSAVAAPPHIPPGHDEPELVLTNGKIHTMDDHERVVDAVAIKNGRISAVGEVHARPGPRTKIINLRGKTVVPGLVESHTHFVSLANRPGYHVAQWELANSIAEVQAILAARRDKGDVPVGQFITAMGAGTPGYFAEGRLPTLAELDAAVPDRPVFLYQGGGGPARVNTLGKQFFESVSSPLAGPCVVGDDGSLNTPAGNHSNRALYHLRVRQTFEDKMRSALDAMAYTASVGVTSLLDETLVAVATGTLDPASLDPQPTHALFNLNHFRMYDAWLALHREGKDFVRLQINFLHNQGFITELGDLDHQLPELRERLKNQFPNFGDHMLRTGGIGEWAAPFALPSNANGHAVWREAQRLVAKAGWRNGNAQTGSTVPVAAAADGIEQVVLAYEAVDAEFGIKHLRWGLQHADHATPDQLARLKALNVAVSMSGFRWNTRNPPRPDGLPVGARFRQILDSGIHAGLHQDGVHIAAHNPWFALHYATTGLNLPFAPLPLGGPQNPQNINPGQQISRQEAMYAYTRDGAWFMNRDQDFGSIEVGKLGDLVVLDKDYFSVSNADMRAIRPVMTVIAGKVVHDTGVLS
jgi:predicted amidohydrolase YtcJ